MDWGLPDWRSPAAYGKTETWPDYRWRWEFARRRQDVRQEFWAYAEQTYEYLRQSPDYASITKEEGRTPNEPGFWAMVPGRPRFGMVGIPNPSIADHPNLSGLFSKDYGSFCVGRGEGWPDDYFPPLLDVPEGTVAIVFSLNRPHRAQLAQAKATLMQFGSPPQRRRHAAVWLQYLRILDAREDRASFAAIAKIVLRRDPERQESAVQAARQSWLQARRLMSSWPI
ncbi:hypothetical protein PZ895_10565 [Mesorhizobium sp. YIM 152430]|uniref:hypothetical protein n=1 Tax=Mesorhizobium sp. YIM 152430 TaxID=3031761 RepID=UPI0023DB740A|nr:hypothetical protein [Mesorhizobium sp. YIM 152430]MDF1600214.1 hypothetical protein [Mesorhizobium sp. YIM 152430]